MQTHTHTHTQDRQTKAIQMKVVKGRGNVSQQEDLGDSLIKIKFSLLSRPPFTLISITQLQFSLSSSLSFTFSSFLPFSCNISSRDLFFFSYLHFWASFPKYFPEACLPSSLLALSLLSCLSLCNDFTFPPLPSAISCWRWPRLISVTRACQWMTNDLVLHGAARSITLLLTIHWQALVIVSPCYFVWKTRAQANTGVGKMFNDKYHHCAY